jgi:hypothetical protein
VFVSCRLDGRLLAFQLLLPKTQDRNKFQTTTETFRVLLFAIAWLQAISAIVMLVTQTTCIFWYEWAVEQHFQISDAFVGPSLVQLFRAYGAADTILYIPLLASSAYGLLQKKRWSLICTAASAGIHSYWALTMCFSMVFLRPVAEYTLEPDLGLVSFVLVYVVYGILVLAFLYHYWNVLMDVLD